MNIEIEFIFLYKITLRHIVSWLFSIPVIFDHGVKGDPSDLNKMSIDVEETRKDLNLLVTKLEQYTKNLADPPCFFETRGPYPLSQEHYSTQANVFLKYSKTKTFENLKEP